MYSREAQKKFNERRTGATTASSPLSGYKNSSTYFALWNAIPSQKPSIFSAFIGRITRNLALKKYEYISASKRNPVAITAFEELGDCVSGTDNVESEVESRQIEDMISTFLWRQGEKKEVLK